MSFKTCMATVYMKEYAIYSTAPACEAVQLKNYKVLKTDKYIRSRFRKICTI